MELETQRSQLSIQDDFAGLNADVWAVLLQLLSAVYSGRNRDDRQSRGLGGFNISRGVAHNTNHGARTEASLDFDNAAAKDVLAGFAIVRESSERKIISETSCFQL